MSKVFIVTSGSYSDYRVESVWTSREKADAEVKRMGESGRSEVDVEEYLLDAGGEGPPYWRVFFFANRTTTARVFGEIEPDAFFVGKHGFQRHGNADITVRAGDEFEAIKIAAERRASLLVKYAGETESEPGRWVYEAVVA